MKITERSHYKRDTTVTLTKNPRAVSLIYIVNYRGGGGLSISSRNHRATKLG